ncbi:MULTISPECIES: hypothetical protein [unclassified Apibacter]|uniref:hypothetical protein n=1 Tax=unclassified Apibacter TaxID=2630820 RepID=UPI00132852D5|nr:MULTISPECIES: hypothetical protein [unclassified Apibacter]MCX8676291.1 hypothetical protein [Apibacter sp. B3919]MXO23756.1 hypothetical protein [Apibacter sp. B3924]MXO26566.1 hypothetical protein [Apibacter sp. B3813]MXO29433.1 hypothetical protein [Apibacter sp. B3913]MXO31385.1 hypothetical protein [Apibacter sp. B3912]
MKEIIDKIISFGDWFITNAFKKEFLFLLVCALMLIPAYIFHDELEDKKREKIECDKNREEEKDEYYLELKKKDEKYDELEKKYIEQNQKCYEKWVEYLGETKKEYHHITKDIQDNEKIIREANEAILRLKKLKKEK